MSQGLAADSHTLSTMPTQSSKTQSEPTVGLIRAFSDHQNIQDPNSTLTRGLGAKVQQDRNRENSLQALQKEWPLLFADADHLVKTLAPHTDIHKRSD